VKLKHKSNFHLIVNIKEVMLESIITDWRGIRNKKKRQIYTK